MPKHDLRKPRCENGRGPPRRRTAGRANYVPRDNLSYLTRRTIHPSGMLYVQKAEWRPSVFDRHHGTGVGRPPARAGNDR